MCCMSSSGKSVDTGRCQNVLNFFSALQLLEWKHAARGWAGAWLRPVARRGGAPAVVETRRTRTRRAGLSNHRRSNTYSELIFPLVLPSPASYLRFLSSSCGALSSRVTPESSARLRMSLTNWTCVCIYICICICVHVKLKVLKFPILIILLGLLFLLATYHFLKKKWFWYQIWSWRFYLQRGTSNNLLKVFTCRLYLFPDIFTGFLWTSLSPKG
jgi:hypothetical protein